MKFIKISTLMLLLLMVNNVSSEDITTSVKFVDPEKFTDFKTQIHSNKVDRQRLMKQLDKLMIASVSKHLKSGQNMEITINNIDMAGTFLYGDNNLYRVVREDDRVRLEFSYRLMDESGKLLNQDDVNLTSRSIRPLKRAVNKYKHSYFTYEMPLFDSWLKTTF